MNLQEFKSKLYKAGWDNPNDAQGTNIKKLWVETFPMDYVIDGLMNEIDRLTGALDEIASIYERGKCEVGERSAQAYDMRCVAREALKN